MALGSTQPLTEMSTMSISWGKGGRCIRLTTLPPSCAVVMKSGNLNFLEPSGPLQARNGTALPYTLKGSKSHIHHNKNPNLMKVTYAWNRSIKAVFTPLLTEAYPPIRHGFLYAQQRHIEAAQF